MMKILQLIGTFMVIIGIISLLVSVIAIFIVRKVHTSMIFHIDIYFVDEQLKYEIYMPVHTD